VDPDGCDADELRRLDASPGLSRLFAGLLECIDPRQAIELFKDALAAKADQSVRDLAPAKFDLVLKEMLAKVGK
jgi:hypothetical protein